MYYLSIKYDVYNTVLMDTSVITWKTQADALTVNLDIWIHFYGFYPKECGLTDWCG